MNPPVTAESTIPKSALPDPKPGSGVIYCRKCGAANARNSQYCDQCSAPLYDPVPAPGAAPPPPAATMPGFSRPTAAPPPAGTMPGLSSPARPEDAVAQAAQAVSAAPPAAPAEKAIAPNMASAAPPAVAPPAGASSEALPAVVGAPPPGPAGKVAVTATTGAKPAKKGGLPIPLIIGALATLLVFVGIGFFALNGVSGVDPQSDVRTAVAQQATVQAQQGDQIRVALTQLADSGGSLGAQQTALAQATQAAVEAQATTTAIIAQVQAIASDKQAAKDAGSGKELVVAAVFAPTPLRAFLTPQALGTPATFSSAPGKAGDSAPLVPVPVTITNKLTADDEGQFYRVDLSKYTGGTLQLSLTAAKAAKGRTRLHLMDETGTNDIDTKFVAAGATDELLVTVPPGIHTIQVEGAADPQNPYTLVVRFSANATSADKDHAVPLGLVGSVQGFINSTEDAHWYKVDMSAYPQGGKFTTALTVPAAAKDAYRLHLVDPGGGTDVQSAYVRPGQNNLVSDEADAAKNYYIVVESSNGFSSSEPYVLATYFQPHSANSTPGNAVKITPPVRAKVRIATPEDTVYMQFEIKATSAVTYTTTMPTDGSGVQVAVTDSNGQSAYGYMSIAPGQTKTETAYLQNPGIYQLRVRGNGGAATSLKPITIDLDVKPTK
jgi:hypothetical protein